MGRVIDMMKSPEGIQSLSVAVAGITFNAPPALLCVGLLLSQALLQFAFSSVLSIAAESMSTRLRKSLFGMPQRKDNFFLED
jgi:hypothetical protein